MEEDLQPKDKEFIRVYHDPENQCEEYAYDENSENFVHYTGMS